MRMPRCPICDQPFDREQTPAMPFCSHRCQLIDLRRWLGEEYSLPVAPADEADEPLDADYRDYDVN